MNRKQILKFAIGPMGAALLGVLSVPVIAWYFSAEDIGRISMLQVTCDFIVIMFSFGLDRAYIREYHETSEAEKPKLLMTSIMPGFLFLLAIIICCRTFFPSLPAQLLFNIESSQLSLIVFACVISAFLARFLSLILRMQEKGLAYSMSQILPKMLFLTAIGIIVLLARGFDFEKLIVAHTISWIAVMLVFAWNTKAVWFRGLKLGINGKKLKFMLGFGLPLAFASLSSWALLTMDRIFLRNMSSFEELGSYTVAMSIASCAGILSSIFTTVWAPTVYKWTAEGKNFKQIDNVSEHILAAAAAILIFCSAFSWLLEYFLPPHFASVQLIVATCMMAILFNTLSEANAVGLGVARKSFLSLLASLLAATINFAGNYLLVPRFGAVGASVASAIAFWIFLLVRTEFARLVWRPFPRAKMYLVTFILLMVDITFAFIGKNSQLNWPLVWTGLGLLWLYLFRKSVTALLYELCILKVAVSNEN